MFDIANILLYYTEYEVDLCTLVNKELKKTDLCNLAGLSRNTLAKMGKEEYVALEVVERICNGLSCRIEDVVEVRE